MVSSYSSSSSFTSSSLGRPPTFTNSSGAGPSSTWVPATSPSVVPGSQNPPALDLGPPGYEATITLYPETKDEKTVYLGPWQITSTTEGICVVWQCSYQDEVLEHFIPCESPSDIYPHTSHAHHRPYHDPSDMERSIVFTDSHHVRYTNEEGETVHDQPITVRYEFTSVDSSRNFQTELRGKELVSFFDADVAWTDLHDRTDAFGQVRGIAVAQRIKLWLDNRTNRYSITILANKLPGRRYMEYDLQMFEREMRERKEHKKQVQLAVQSRRSSGSSQGGRKFSFSRKQRQNSSNSMAETASSSKRERDMRHLYFRFSNREGYRAFVQSWKHAQGFPEAQIPIPFHPQSYQLSTPELSPPSTTANQHSSMVSPLTQASSYQISPNTQASSAFTQTSAASYTSQTSYNTSHGSYASSPDLEHSMSRRLEIVREPDEA